MLRFILPVVCLFAIACNSNPNNSPVPAAPPGYYGGAGAHRVIDLDKGTVQEFGAATFAACPGSTYEDLYFLPKATVNSVGINGYPLLFNSTDSQYASTTASLNLNSGAAFQVAGKGVIPSFQSGQYPMPVYTGPSLPSVLIRSSGLTISFQAGNYDAADSIGVILNGQLIKGLYPPGIVAYTPSECSLLFPGDSVYLGVILMKSYPTSIGKQFFSCGLSTEYFKKMALH